MMAPEFESYKFKYDKEHSYDFGIQSGAFTPTTTTHLLIAGIQSDLGAPGKTLDLGCGIGVTGIVSHQLGLIAGPLYASDLSEAAIACTTKNCEKYDVSVVAKTGSMFEPWTGEKFDAIFDDVSGVASEIAEISPWFNGVPCETGSDGTSLINQILQESPQFLKKEGRIYFPLLSLSNTESSLNAARQSFAEVRKVSERQWPLPKEMLEHKEKLNKMKDEGKIGFDEKFGMILWTTSIYCATNG